MKNKQKLKITKKLNDEIWTCDFSYYPFLEQFTLLHAELADGLLAVESDVVLGSVIGTGIEGVNSGLGILGEKFQPKNQKKFDKRNGFWRQKTKKINKMNGISIWWKLLQNWHLLKNWFLAFLGSYQIKKSRVIKNVKIWSNDSKYPFLGLAFQASADVRLTIAMFAMGLLPGRTFFWFC